MALIFKNNVSSVLASAFGPTDTTITLENNGGDDFPQISSSDDDYFYVTLENNDGEMEICKIVDVSGDVLTVEDEPALSLSGREHETVPVPNNSWVTGDRIEMRLTALALSELLSLTTDAQRGATYLIGTDDGSTINNYKVALDPPVTSLVDGQRIYFVPVAGSSSQGPSVINVDGIGDTQVVYSSGNTFEDTTPDANNAIVGGIMVGVIYSSAIDSFILTHGGVDAYQVRNGGQGSELDADLLDGYEETDFARLARSPNIFLYNIGMRNEDDTGVRGIYYQKSTGDGVGSLTANLDSGWLQLISQVAGGAIGGALYLNQDGRVILRGDEGQNVVIEAIDGDGDININTVNDGAINLTAYGGGGIVIKSGGGDLFIQGEGGDVIVNGGPGGDFRQDSYKVALEGISQWYDYDEPNRQLSESLYEYVYQNLTTRDIQVTVSDGFDSDSNGSLHAYVGPTSSPALIVAQASAAVGSTACITFTVPVDHYYSVRHSTVQYTPHHALWVEYRNSA